MRINPIGNSRIEFLNEQLPSNVKTREAFPPLRVGGADWGWGEVRVFSSWGSWGGRMLDYLNGH